MTLCSGRRVSLFLFIVIYIASFVADVLLCRTFCIHPMTSFSSVVGFCVKISDTGLCRLPSFFYLRRNHLTSTSCVSYCRRLLPPASVVEFCSRPLPSPWTIALCRRDLPLYFFRRALISHSRVAHSHRLVPSISFSFSAVTLCRRRSI